MVGLHPKLLGQLAVRHLDDLPHSIDALDKLFGQLPPLVGTGQCTKSALGTRCHTY
jgi:hypothetical protein